VVRIWDEFTVDLMAKACGMSYSDAESLIEFREHLGVKIPFASPALRWKTKQTFRTKMLSTAASSVNGSKTAASGRWSERKKPAGWAGF
jgi:hypothetical protein